MPEYIEFTLDDNSTILIEAPSDFDEDYSGIEEVSVGDNAIKKAQKTFSQALSSVKKSFVEFNKNFQDLDVDEMELTASIKMTGKATFGIGNLGAEGSMQIKLVWKNPKKA